MTTTLEFKRYLVLLTFYLLSYRLKYLLNQSDIFSHFGVGSKTGQAIVSSAPSANITKSRGRRSTTALDEMDDDERAMAEAAGGDDDNDDEKVKETIMLRQPSCVSGGTMRYILDLNSLN